MGEMGSIKLCGDSSLIYAPAVIGGPSLRAGVLATPHGFVRYFGTQH